MTSHRVAVIGSGLNGLIAAHTCRERGLEVELFEARNRAGGSLRTRTESGWMAEVGPMMMPGLPEEYEQFFGQAGLPLSERVVASDSAESRYLIADGSPVEVPTTPAGMIASPLLSVSGRLRLLREPFVARGTADPNETVMSFASRRFGSEMAERFIDPVVSAASGGDPRQLVAEHALADLVGLEQRSGSILKGRMRAARRAKREGQKSLKARPWSCSDGMAGVARRLAASLGERVLLDSEVSELSCDTSGWVVTTTDGDSNRFSAVVSAVGAVDLAAMKLGGAGADDVQSAMADMPHASVASVSLGFDRSQVEHPLEGFGVLGSGGEKGGKLRSVVFASSVFPNRAPEDCVLLTVTLGGVAHPELVAESDGDLVRTALEEITSLLGVDGDPKIALVDRRRDALPQAVRGHHERIVMVEEFERANSNLVFTGAWRDGLSVTEAIKGGRRAANRIASVVLEGSVNE